MMIWRPILCEQKLCALKDLEDGTYSINDLMDMHEALDLIEVAEKENAST